MQKMRLILTDCSRIAAEAGLFEEEEKNSEEGVEKRR